MDLSRFGAVPPWSLGVEEELMLVDAETLEPGTDGFSRVFGEATERIKPELFESFVEITTTVVETPEEAEAQLRASAERGGRTGGGARPRGDRDGLASDRARTRARSCPSSATGS